MAKSYLTKSQLIAKLCLRRKALKEAMTCRLLKGEGVEYSRVHLENLDSQIRDLHKPAYLSKARKPQ